MAYVPVKNESGKVVSMAFTGVSREAVESQISKSIIFMVIIAVVVLLISILVAIKLSGGMAGAIEEINNSIKHLANGEFVKADRYLDRTDELGICLNNTNSLIDTLDEIVADIKKNATSVSSSSQELSATVTTLAGNASNLRDIAEHLTRDLAFFK